MPMRALHHASERRVKCEMLKRLAEICSIDAAGIIAERVLATFEIRHQRKIGVARFRIWTRPAVSITSNA